MQVQNSSMGIDLQQSLTAVKTSHILENGLYASEHEKHVLKVPLEKKTNE